MFGRRKGAWTNHKKRIERLAAINGKATTEYAKLLENPTFLAGLVLYLAEGSKKTERFEFMNSDPYLIKLMIIWITEVYGEDFNKIGFRLKINELYVYENCEQFWARFLKSKPEQFMKTIY